MKNTNKVEMKANSTGIAFIVCLIIVVHSVATRIELAYMQDSHNATVIDLTNMIDMLKSKNDKLKETNRVLFREKANAWRGSAVKNNELW